jgi:hypothetical protein
LGFRAALICWASANPTRAGCIRPHRQKPAAIGTSQRRSKRARINVERALEAPAPHSGMLSTANFDQSEWEIMYPMFVEEGLTDPSEYVNRRNV